MRPQQAPKLRGFLGGGACRRDFKGGAAVRHRGSVIDPVVDDGLKYLAVPGERGHGLHGDAGITLGLREHEDEGACPIA